MTVAVTIRVEARGMSLRLVAMWNGLALGLAFFASHWLPLPFAFVVGTALWAFGLLHVQRSGARRFEQQLARVEAVKGIRTAGGRISLWSDPGWQQNDLLKRLTKDLEDAYLKLIQTNIQLLSLKEVGRSIIASLDRYKTMDSVVEYLKRGVGFSEYGLFVANPSGRFEGGIRRRQGNRFTWDTREFEIHQTSGVLAKCLGQQRSYLIKDAPRHGIGAIAGQELFPEVDFGSYVIVPLVCSSPKSRRAKPVADCPRCSDDEQASWRQDYAAGASGLLLDEGPLCPDCSGAPLLGCILVTDSNREQTLSKVDLVMLETLAQNLATVLENAQLYEDLRHEERFRENVMGGMSNGLLSIDLDNCITLFNQTAQRLTGYASGEMLGRPSSDLFFSDANGRNPLSEALQDGLPKRGVETGLRTSDGRSLPVQLSTSLLRDDSGRVYGVIGEFADLSHIKSMEAQIRHLDKLAAMGRFTSSIAHEIRNPLAGITAGIQYLTRNKKGPEAEHASFILAEVDRLNRIINDLFTAGRPLNLAFRQADVAELVARCVRSCETVLVEKKIHCLHNCEEGLPLANIDPDRIEQVLINFIRNAAEASPEGSTIEIEARMGSSLAPMDRDAESDSMILSVSDQGEGISAEDLDKIFEPFFTKKSTGTGLGLYVCHHIVEGHGGSIAVDSEPGHGSRFLLCLPLGRILMGGTSETADLARR